MPNPRSSVVFRVLSGLILLLWLPGCGWFARQPPTPGPISLHNPRLIPATRPLLPVARVRLLKIVVPAGTCSGNGNVWRRVKEDVLDSPTALLLAHNGLRAATAPVGAWPELAELLNVPGATTQEFFCQTDGRSVILVPTRQNIPEQTVFYFDQEVRQYGRTFARCDNALRLGMARQKGSPDTLIQVEPVVQVGTISVQRGPNAVGVTALTAPQEETFANLRLAIQLPSDQFLLLAPADPNAQPFSVGTRFLSESDKVPPMETVLVLVPLPDSPPR